MKLTNKRLISALVVISVGLTSIFYANFNLSLPVNKIQNEKTITILIDPGHGGIDGGAQSRNGTCEKDINLNISKKLKDMLISSGYNVVMTREKDMGLYGENKTVKQKKVEDLNNRCKMKKDSSCDIFMSIHLNMFPESKYSGAQVWYSKNPQSQELASVIQGNLKKDIDPNNNREQKPALDSYKVLRCNDDMPSVLIECGFLSNPSEEQKLKTDAYQTSIAKCLCNSINQYCKSKQ